MAAQTSIEWAANADGTPGATWNPIRARDTRTGKVGTFCVHASPGCVNCYAERFQARGLPNNGIGLPYAAGHLRHVEFFIDEKMLALPIGRRKPTTWFLSSLTDVFGEWATDAMLDRLWATMAQASRHLFIVVTKRSARARQYLSDLPRRIDDWNCDSGLDWVRLPLPNVWIVASIEDQPRADERVYDLMQTPAAIRGLSCEPLIGPVDLARLPFAGNRDLVFNALDPENYPRIDWVIAGGESGPGARPMHPDWARSLRDQCAAASVPFFFKQWGEWAPFAEIDRAQTSLRRVQTMPIERGAIYINTAGQDVRAAPIVAWMEDGGPSAAGVAALRKVGKGRAGRLLSGVEHNARPPLPQAPKETNAA